MLKYSVSLIKNDDEKGKFKFVITPGALCLPTVRFTKCLLKNGKKAYKEFEDVHLDVSLGLFENLDLSNSSEVFKVSDEILVHLTRYPRLTKYITFRKELIEWISKAQDLCRRLGKYSVVGKYAIDSNLIRKEKITLETRLSERVKVFHKTLDSINKGSKVILYQVTMSTDPNVIPEHIHWYMEFITKDSPKEFKYERPFMKTTTDESRLLKLMEKSF